MADKIRQLATAAIAAATSSKNKYFTNSRKGENFELKAELNSASKSQKKEAVKKVIANMTVGKDVSPLFPDVLKCMQTEDLELKKLVYLYLMNYAKTQPELVVLAVNTFCKDTEDPNPLIRALAIRTMGCIRVDKMMDYLCEPLRKTLCDENPYVRKTAALCVAKVYDLSPELAEENGFLTSLQAMLSDSNPMVVSNAVAALCEIQEVYPNSHALKVDSFVLSKLLAALNECTEWGQTFILDALAEYKAANVEEAQSIVERVIPRLQHANGAVTLSAVKVLMIYLEKINANSELFKTISKKLSSSLVTLLSLIPEVQYVALRNIKLILHRYPDMLSQDIRVFFCKYNDPLYVKLEKLDVMVKLASDSNLDQVLSEFKEYSAEVDVEFVKRAIQSIGLCALNVVNAADRAIAVLVDLLKTKITYVVQESVVVITEIFRKYPNQYEAIIPIMCESLESMDSAEAKASMIWIVGEYAEKIENAQGLIEFFSENFESESVPVQLQLLTASVKLLLKRGVTGLADKCLQSTINTSENPDLRDRAFFYTRLLAIDQQTAASIVFAPKPIIVDSSSDMNPTLVNELIHNISSLASVFHQPAATFVSTARSAPIMELSQSQIDLVNRSDNIDEVIVNATAVMGVQDLLDLDMTASDSPSAPMPMSGGSAGKVIDLMSDELMVETSPVTSAPQPDFFARAASPSAQSKPVVAKVTLTTYLHENQGKGLSIQGAFSINKSIPSLDLTLTNNSQTPLTDFAIQFNKNSFGLLPAAAITMNSPLQPNASMTASIPLSFSGPVLKMTPINALQVAFKNNVDIFYFQIDVPFNVFFNRTLAMNEETFNTLWNSASETLSKSIPTTQELSSASAILNTLGFTVIEDRNNTNKLKALACCVNNLGLAVELTFQFGTSVNIELKSTVIDVMAPFMRYMESALHK